MEKKIITMVFLLLVLIQLTQAAIQTGVSGEIGIDLIPASSTFNNQTAAVNVSNYWETNLGNLENVNATQFEGTGGTLTIMLSWLSSVGNGLWCALAGCTMEGDINMDTNDIINVTNISIQDQLQDSFTTSYIEFMNGTVVVMA